MANVKIFSSIFMANPWEVFYIFFIDSNWEHNAMLILKTKMLII